MSSFAELTNVRAGDVKPPVMLPPGHYEAMLAGSMTPHTAKSKNVAMRFPFQVLSAGDDVDADALEAAGGIPEKSYNIDYWMSPDAQFRFVDFAKSCGLYDENLTLVEIAERMVEEKARFTIEHSHQADANDAEKIYSRWDKAVGHDAG